MLKSLSKLENSKDEGKFCQPIEARYTYIWGSVYLQIASLHFMLPISSLSQLWQFPMMIVQPDVLVLQVTHVGMTAFKEMIVSHRKQSLSRNLGRFFHFETHPHSNVIPCVCDRGSSSSSWLEMFKYRTPHRTVAHFQVGVPNLHYIKNTGYNIYNSTTNLLVFPGIVKYSTNIIVSKTQAKYNPTYFFVTSVVDNHPLFF